MKYFSWCFLGVFVLLLSACTTPPPKEIVVVPENDIALAEVLNTPDKFHNAIVRWGGRILRVEELLLDNEIKKLKVEVLEFPLGEDGFPLTTEASSGRFMVLINQPYKKSSYYRNRYVTVIGEITGSEERQLAGDNVQHLPIIRAKEKYAWSHIDDHQDGIWPRILYRIGISRGNVGIGVIFH